MRVLSARIRAAEPWRGALLTILLLWAAILTVHWRTAASMTAIWSSSDTFAHGYLVLPISLWLIWRRRDQLGAIAPQARAWPLLPLAAVVLLWLVADLASVNAASHFALVAMLVLSVPAVLGPAAAKAILFPLNFLFFAVPFGEFMLQPMMEWTADFVVSALRLTGVPVFREGLLFVIPTGSWSVIDECSGVRYLIASFMVGTLFAYLNYRSYKRRAAFMLVSLLVPIVANWLRAYLIVMMGHVSENRIAVGVDHLLYGWIFFGIVIFVMFAIGSRWSEPEVESAQPGATSHANAGPSRPASDNGGLRSAVAVLAIVVTPPIFLWNVQRIEAGASSPALQLPDRFGSWSATDRSITSWKPNFTHPSIAVSKVYSGSSGDVGVYVAYYRHQQGPGKLVSGQNGLVHINDRAWIHEPSESRTLAGAQFRTSKILGRDAQVLTRRPHVVAWRTFWVGGRFVAGDVAAKLAGVLERLRGAGDDGAAVILFADEPSTGASNAAIEAFVTANLPQLAQLLAKTRDAR